MPLLLALLVLLGLGPPRPAHALLLDQDAAALDAGARVTKNIAGGETHLFRLALTGGQFVRVLVEQKGVDVVVALVGPGGRRLLEVDSPNGSNGLEPLSAVAEESGEHLIEVRAPDRRAPAGIYELVVEALRDPTPSDRDRLRAERAFAEAYKLSSQPGAESKRAALGKFQAALPAFRALGDRVMELLTLKTVAVGHHSSGALQEALRYYGEALSLARGLGDERTEALLLNNLGGVYDILGEPQQALDHYRRALAFWHAQDNRSGQGDTLNNIGVIHFNLGDLQQALDYYEQALPLRRAGNNRRKEADTLDNISLIYLSLGEPRRALESLQQALELRRAAKDIQGEANSLHHLGYTHAGLGDLAKALDYYRLALPLRRAAGDRRGEGITLNNIGAAYSSLGEPGQATAHHLEALQLLRAVGDRREEAFALTHLGRAQALSGRAPEAVAYYAEALSLFRAIGHRRGEAWAHQSLALVERDRGHLAEARRHIEAALSIIETMRAGVASRQLRTSFFASKQDAYEFYIDLLMRAHRREPAAGHDAAALRASERARARGLLEMLSESGADIRRGVAPELLARERRLSQLLDAKAERLMRLPGQPGAQARAAALRKELEELEAEHQQVQGDIRRRSPHYASITQPEPLSAREIQQRLLDRDTLLLEFALGSERSYLWAVTRDSLKSYELPGREQIEAAARQVYGLLTARSARRKGESSGQKRERVRRADAELPEAAARLSRMVLGPVAAELGARRLVIVADGALQYIPFAMLPTPRAAGARRPLILEHEIVSLPSASALAVQRRELAGREAAPKDIAVFADPVFESADARVKPRAGGAGRPAAGPAGGAAGVRLLEHTADVSGGVLSVPRLPYTRREAERILATAQGGANLKALDFKASLATARGGELAQYRYVHFATHAYIDSERRGLSAIVLSLVDEHGEPRDGFLNVREIYDLSLPAELVVLSACQTGLGAEIRGEGLVGLTRGFMYAGAARVVVSLWNVSDEGTAGLMERLYVGIKQGLSPAAALRAAQIETLRQARWQSPYYWAAFIHQGEWK